MIFEDLTGRLFGRLTVQWPVGHGSKGKIIHWLCLCVCGRLRIVGGTNLKKAVSCGCFTSKVTHGHTKGKVGTIRKSPEYTAWDGIIQRCTNRRNKSWKDYGGRGIKICAQWRKSFTTFVRDVGSKPHPDLMLDRINNDGNYEPGNVRWTTRLEQNRNKRQRKSRSHYAAI